MPPFTVLFIDYKGPFTEIARHYLSMFSVISKVTISNNGDHIIEMVRDLRPHIVFINPIFMGGHTMEICNKIKTEVENTKIIEITIFKTLFNGYARDMSCFDGHVSREYFGDDVLTLIKKMSS